MNIKKKIRIVLSLYLIILICLSAYGFVYGFQILKSIEQIPQNNEIRRNFEENSTFALQAVLSPVIGILSLLITILGIISWISLFFFWRVGPILFALNIVFSYIIFPILTGWWQSISSSSNMLSKLSSTPEPNFIVEPKNYILLILSGVILTLIFSKEGKSVFESGKSS